MNDIKQAIRKRDGEKCADCGMTSEEHIDFFGRRLHVHRRKQGSKYTEAGCFTLCMCCHHARHGAKTFRTDRRKFGAGKIPMKTVSFDLDKIALTKLMEIRRFVKSKYRTNLTISSALCIAIREAHKSITE